MPSKDPAIRKVKKYENCKRWRLENRERYLELKKAYNDRNKDKIRNYNRKHKLKILYNVTEEEYQVLLSKQGGKCAICGSDKPHGNKSSKRFQIDHNHTTKVVRGLLCSKCNRGLGLLGDTVERIEKVLSYLKEIDDQQYITKSTVQSS